MSTPPKATPTTPRWAIEAAKEYFGHWTGNCEDPAKSSMERMSAIIAKHAPPLSPPTDEAGLREVIGKVLGVNRYLAGYPQARATLADKLLTALAPHLSQREPGDSDGEVLRGKLMSAGDLTLLEDQNAIEETGVFVKCTREALRALNGNLVYEEVEIRKSAQRGEGKP